MINKVPYLISAIIIGLIIYQSGFIAPSINKIIDKDNASIYLRFIWPKFFLIIAFLSIVSFIVIYFLDENQLYPKYLSLGSFVLMILSYLLIPFINNARDSENNSLFFYLHLLSMIFTLITLIVNVLIIKFWNSN
ncbi:MAG: hypothetical protein VYC21_00300 [Bacteroidota bacterium]|nr:hypothetical protein [Flavobacteriaceae bacterium]MEC7869392.1 hypothetical protein [Bacteroidota bacterium]|tara:strand:- start:171 stop:575 length:405 start_codon:yes stop_codon:yes gene_type:complete